VHLTNLEANDLAPWIDLGVDVKHVIEEEMTVYVKMGHVSDSGYWQ
jgi:hypothetical protein